MSILKSFKSFLSRFSKAHKIESYSSCRETIETLLKKYQDSRRFKIRKSKLSDNVWSVEVVSFIEAIFFFTRVIRKRGFQVSKSAGNHKYLHQVDSHTTLMLTDKVRKESSQVANLYLTDKLNKEHKRMIVHFIQKK